jgi:carbon-monoxide dehydrogenase iron sulfur subunit
MEKNEIRNMILIANPRACIGCRSCELACSFYHYKEFNPARAFVHIVKDEEKGLDIPVICNHCDQAPCMSACPVEAIKRDSEINAVIIDSSKCIGCRACISACPFGAIMIDPKTGDINKCDLCGGNPRCASACKQGAIIYSRKDVATRILARYAARKTMDILTSDTKKKNKAHEQKRTQ